jgi:hypothetical protein
MFFSGDPKEQPGHIWEVSTGKELALFGQGNGIDAFSSSPDGKLLVALRGQLTLYRPDTGTVLRTYDAIPSSLGDRIGFAISQDSRIFASAHQHPAEKDARSRTLMLWEMATGTRIATVKGHKEVIEAIAFSDDGRLIATGSWDGTVRLWELASMKQLVCFSGHRGGILSLSFSPDGKRLASGGSDTTILVWDIARWATPKAHPAQPLTVDEFNTLWAILLQEDASVAYPALWKLVAAQETSVALIKQRLSNAKLDEKQVSQWIADLDSDNFPVREKATKALAALGPSVKPLLQKALENPPSGEARLRMEKILASLSVPKGAVDGQKLRTVRAVQVLEYIGCPTAAKCLKSLAQQHPHAPLGQQAKTAFERLTRKLCIE